MQFKVGDRVRFNRNHRGGLPSIGKEETIVRIDGNEIWTSPTGNAVPRSNNGDATYCNCGGECMDLVQFYSTSSAQLSYRSWYETCFPENKPKRSSFMNKLSIAFKKAVSADLQTQIKAGFRDDALNLTETGKTTLLEIIASSPAGADYQALFAQAANDEVAAQIK